MEQVDGSPFNQQEYIQMIEKQKQLLYKEKNKNEERYLTLETLIHRSSKIVLAEHLPLSIILSRMPVSLWTCLPPPVTATQVLSQPCSLTTPMPMFYPCTHMRFLGVTSMPLSTSQHWPPQQQQSTGFYTGINGLGGFNMASQPFPL